ncbi:hypothetical protein AMTR_s00010p00234230 [Amborella trichopoda]|uniref:Uncharacterized protein n=1 Tax=Amborella trichopoda TaxID=13333 RepID=W1NGH5_AMBTC|nr:hypothetical protein AMTR_s00010p00234230 [Amborella trichopoda]
MATTVKDVISLVQRQASSIMFGAAEAVRANFSEPQELRFTNLFMVNDEAGDLKSEILGSFASQIQNKLKIQNKLENSLRVQASLVECFELVEAIETKEDVWEMPCLHQYHEDWMCKWLECNKS